MIGIKASPAGTHAIIQIGGVDKAYIGNTGNALELVNNTTLGNYTQRTLTSAVATTSGTSIDFTGIPSWAKRITVYLYDVSTSSTSLMLVRVGTSAGGVLTSGYASYDMRTGNSGIGSGQSTVGVAVPSAGLATYSRLGKVVFEKFSDTAWIISGSWVHGQSATPDGAFISGVVLAGVIDRVRLTTVNGTDTFDAGSSAIYIEG